ncbi:MFS transporter [Nigerium massiliense]|uniref:MFS transporter n=1 Tax=Nigerium massiliense TaxID=1522317 RepID=UPI000693E24C|nr:MFS transporter [Nigerium massiliense]
MSENPVKNAAIVRHKPMMTMKQILLMNLGFFGVQYSFGMQQTAINPIYSFLGASHEDLPLLNLAGPVTGLFIQPLIGALSDRTWISHGFFRGRRRPFFLIGAFGCALSLALFPFVWAVWMAVLLLWIMDASNNTAMEPYRAFIADRLPPSQLGKGFLAQSFFTGLGITLANLSLMFFQSMFGVGQSVGIPLWVYPAFFLGSVSVLVTILVSVISTPELEPNEKELAAMRAQKGRGGIGKFVSEIKEAVVDMPVQMRKLALVYLFQWYAMNCYWQYISLSVSQSLYGTTDSASQGYQHAVADTGVLNGAYNIVTFCVAFWLVALARRWGAKWVHAICLWCATVGLVLLPQMPTLPLKVVAIIGLGVAWASIMGVPYIMIVRMVPSTRYGVYMGIVNMMIVIPMLIQTLSFGAIYKNLLGDNPNNAIVFAGVFLGIAGLIMLWIKEPPIVRDVDTVDEPATALGD